MWSHAIGAVLAVAALIIMVAVSLGDPWRVTAAAVFGATLVLLYGASTLYHAFSCPRLKPFLQIIDHAAIYLLIAGSYTPLTLVAMRGAWGWTLFGTVWFLAIVGIVVKAVMRGRRETRWSTALYLAMGWLVLVAIRPLLAALPPTGLAWLVGGGLCYSFGIIFFVRETMRFNHAIWHGFVIAGSACHVVATTVYMLR